GCLVAADVGPRLRDEGPVAVDEIFVEAAFDASTEAHAAADVEHVLQPKLQADQPVVDADGDAIAGLAVPGRGGRAYDGGHSVHRGGVQRLAKVDGSRADAEAGDAEQAGEVGLAAIELALVMDVEGQDVVGSGRRGHGGKNLRVRGVGVDHVR